MKKILFITLGLVFCLFSVQAALADRLANSEAHVLITVDPNISMGAEGTNVVKSVQTGEISGSSDFRIDANGQFVAFTLTCTNLYKADDPNNTDVEPILTTDQGYIEPQMGAGRGIDLPDAADHNSFLGLMSSEEAFESSQNGHFSQLVTVTCTWNQDDPEKPQGDYSGWIVLAGMVLGADGDPLAP